MLYFKNLMVEDGDIATAVAAIRTLIEYIEQSEADTLSELRNGIKSVISALTCSMSSKITSVSSGQGLDAGKTCPTSRLAPNVVENGEHTEQCSLYI